MAEVKKLSPKKVPIDDWVKAVKNLDGSGLKDEEKKVFEIVRGHKNIPKAQNKFANFCIHNLKVKNDKVINKVWSHLSAAMKDQKIQPKETKEIKKAKIEEKHKPSKPSDSSAEKKVEKKNKAKMNDKQEKQQAQKKKGQESATNGVANKQSEPMKKNKPEVKQSPAKDAPTNDNKMAKKVKGAQQQGQKKPAAEKNGLSNDTSKGNNKKAKLATKDLPNKNKQVAKQETKGPKQAPKDNKVQGLNAKQATKKKVSFSKNDSVSEVRLGNKNPLVNAHKQTPKKKQDVKGPKATAKNLKKLPTKQDEDSDEDDYSDFSDSDIEMDSDDDLEEGDENIDDEGSDDELSFDEEDSLDDDEELDDEDDSDDDDDDDDDDDE